MLDLIQAIDESIIIAVNNYNSPFFDGVMWWISGKYSWWPLYFGLIIFIIWFKGFRWGSVIILLTILSVAAADQTSVHLFKEVIQRPRPSHNPVIEEMLHYVKGYRGGAYGFISSHAANSFTVASFISLVIRKKWLTVIMAVWGILVSYSRMYLGVHYLTDILAGAAWGVVLGLLFYSIYKMILRYRLSKNT